MNASDLTPHSVAGSEPNPLASDPDFSVPELISRSIALPSEFDELLRIAADENARRSLASRVARAIFRRQRSDTRLLQVVESLGRSLSYLVHEIEGRELVLAKQVTEVARSLKKIFEQASALSISRDEALTASVLACDSRLNQMQAITAEFEHQLTELRATAERRETEMRELTARLVESDQRAGGQAAEFERQLTGLRATAERRETEMRELTARLVESDQRAGEQATEFERQLTGLRATAEGREAEVRDLAIRVAETNQRDAMQWSAATTRESALVASIHAAGACGETLTSEVDVLRRYLASLGEAVGGVAKRQESSETALIATKNTLETLLPKLQAQLERLIKTDAISPRLSAASKALELVDQAENSSSDAFYVALEARFRGSKAAIRERQTRYLPMIEEARKRIDDCPAPSSNLDSGHPLARLQAGKGVLDLGCGRGEWLDLLKEQQVPTLGVDRNRFFLNACREQGLEVVDADLIDFLRSAPDESVAAITAFHVIEHLPIPVFQEMVSHVFRILRRGGIAIFETPNPTNMLTSSLNFLIDPTHLRPVHPEFAHFMLETGGFASVRLEFLSAYESSYQVGSPDDPLARRFNDYFYGPQDYAVVGVKP